MMRTVLMFLMLVSNLGCAGLAFDMDPSRGDYAVTFSAKDCIDTTNVVGSFVYAIPWAGPKAVAVFGCPADVSP